MTLRHTERELTCFTLNVIHKHFNEKLHHYNTILSSWYIWVLTIFSLDINLHVLHTTDRITIWGKEVFTNRKHQRLAKTEQNWIKMNVLIKSGFLNIQRSKKYVEMNKLKYMRLNEWTKKTHTMNEKGKCLLETLLAPLHHKCWVSSKCQKYWTRLSSSLRWVLGKSSIISPCYINSSGIEQSV